MPLRIRFLTLVAAGVLLTGCLFRGDDDSRCAKPEEYESSRSLGQLEVPPGMNDPDQGDEVIIPKENAVKVYPDLPPCLEKPPDYFGRPVD